jgi:hypothetical protein
MARDTSDAPRITAGSAPPDLSRATSDGDGAPIAAARGPGCRLLAALCLAVGLLASWPAGRLAAQETWEYSPYDIQIWLALAPSAELTDRLAADIEQTIYDSAWTVAGAAWQVQTRRCPEVLEADAVADPAAVTVDDVLAVAPDVVKTGDKLYLVTIDDRSTEFAITVRELDCRTRSWQPAVSQAVVQPQMIASTVFALFADAFCPIVRIESTRGREAQARVRAGGLIMTADSPAAIHDQDVFLPIIRRDDRLGEPMQNGIQRAPWTFLTITGRKGNVLQCDVQTGMRSTLGGRSSSRVVKLGLRVRPRDETTRLTLSTQTEPSQPLDGYEIHAKNPVTEESELIGISDWRGMIRIPRADSLLRLVYVRNGGRLLARLPMVPGLDRELSVQLPNDDQRLQAEGFVKGLQHRVMDLVARRELYAARFRRYLANKKFDEAKALLEEYRNLETRSDLTRQLDQQEQRITSPDRRVQAKIDQLFSDTRQLLARFLDPRTTNVLAEELLKAQQQS